MRTPFLAALALLVAAPVLAAEAPAQETREAARKAPVAVGDLAPDFTLQSHDGRPVTLSGSRGKPTVLVFYRGHW